MAAIDGGHEAFAGIVSSLSHDFESVFVALRGQTRIGPHQGIEGFAAGWRDWLEPWERYELRAEEFIDAGDHVVVLAHVRARTRRDGVEMEHSPAAVYTLRDGLVCCIEFYLDRSEAFQAAGVSR